MSAFPEFPVSYLYLAGGGVVVIGLMMVIQVCSRDAKNDIAHMVIPTILYRNSLMFLDSR